MKKQFDTTKPHKHQCPYCYQQVYCRGLNCDIPQYAECLECQRDAVEVFVAKPAVLRYSTGYRKTCRPYQDWD